MLQPSEYEYLLHEIKNYICLISGSLQLITKQHPEVREFRHWNEILSDTNHLSQMCREFSASNLHTEIHLQLVNPIRFFCSLENDAIELLKTLTASNVAKLSDDAELPYANIHFSINIPQELSEIEIDPVQIKHALINLIKNASEAITDTGNITLYVSASSEEKHLYIQVQDNGCGIDSDQLDKIFLPAYTTKPTGSGIGLCITRSIIEAHGGRIHCQSRPGEGTTFTLILPFSPTTPFPSAYGITEYQEQNHQSVRQDVPSYPRHHC